jgi:hypothetical protein
LKPKAASIAEKKDGVKSSRYSGHQLNRKQASAILGKRGWITSFEDGDCARTRGYVHEQRKRG